MSGERPAAPEASPTSYDLQGVMASSGPSSVPRGTNLLISGGAMSGKTDLALAAIRRGVEAGQHAIVVTPDAGAERIRSAVGSPDRLQVVDCTGTSGSFEGTGDVEFVSSPGDLTGIGIGLTKCTQRIGADAVRGVRIGVLSLSTILRYAGLDSVFNFVHVLTGRIEAAGYLGVFTLAPSGHDVETVETIRAQFDGVVELRDAEDGRREARTLGFGGSREWAPFGEKVPRD